MRLHLSPLSLCCFNVFSSSVIFVLILLLSYVTHSTALYEDQIGKFDWRHRFIGRVDHVLRPRDVWQEHQSVIVSTRSGVVGGLHLRNGSIHWRNELEGKKSLDYLASGTPKNSRLDPQCPVITVNDHGRWIRCWTTSGVLLLEHSLPQEFLVEIDKDPSNINLQFEFTLTKDTKDPSLLIMKTTYSQSLIELLEYNLNSKQLRSIRKVTAGKWLDRSTSCHLIGSDYLICTDQKEQQLQFWPFAEDQFKRFPLSTFGLKSSQTNQIYKFLTLKTLPNYQDQTVTISTKQSVAKYFALNIGGEGMVLFKITTQPAATINLVKIFPLAVQLTLIPLTSQQEGEADLDESEFGVAVLFTKKESIPYQDKSDARHGERVFAVKLAIFHLDTWNEVESISSKSILLEFGSKTSIAPIVSTGKLVKRLDDEWSIDKFEIIPIRGVSVVKGRSQRRYTYKMLLSTEDGTLIVTNLMGKVSWSREEALAEIVSLTMLDLPLSETEATLEQEYGFGGTSRNVLTLFVTRIKSQLVQLSSFVRSLQHSIQHLMTRISVKRTSRRLSDEERELNPHLDSEESLEEDVDEEEEILVRDYFGLHKVILVRTQVGKLFAIDSLSGKVIWSKYEPKIKVESSDVKFPIWTQRTSAHFPHSAMCTFLVDSPDESLLYSFDPFTGQQIELLHLPYKIIQAMLAQTIYDSEFRRPILILDSNYNAHLYPETAKDLFSRVAPTYYMMILNRTSGQVTGYNFAKSDAEVGPVAQPVWGFKLPQDVDKIVSIQAVFKRPHEHVHSQGRVLGDRNVLYKYLNPNLVTIVCESTDQQNSITLYMVDSITGNIVYSIVHRRARGPVQMVHSENWVIYSYYNDKMRRNEIGSIELYEGLNQINGTAFSSLGRDIKMVPFVEQKSFIFPTGIGVMTDTETQKGITTKHILISLPTGGLLELPRAFLDPRRPIKPTQEHAEEGLIPYMPELPIPSEAMINYNQTIMSVRGIVTAPTTLESTSLVFAYGLDIYYTRATPSKTFDILKDDFDYLLIMAVLLALIALSYLAKYLSARKSLNAAWK